MGNLHWCNLKEEDKIERKETKIENEHFLNDLNSDQALPCSILLGKQSFQNFFFKFAWNGKNIDRIKPDVLKGKGQGKYVVWSSWHIWQKGLHKLLVYKFECEYWRFETETLICQPQHWDWDFHSLDIDLDESEPLQHLVSIIRLRLKLTNSNQFNFGVK